MGQHNEVIRTVRIGEGNLMDVPDSVAIKARDEAEEWVRRNLAAWPFEHELMHVMFSADGVVYLRSFWEDLNYEPEPEPVVPGPEGINSWTFKDNSGFFDNWNP